MHEQKEKRRCFHHRTTHDDDDDDDERCQVDSVPLDLTFEILSRLPAKSIFRFLCVSKLWASFIKLPSFIKTFTTHSSARPPSLVVTFSLSRERFVFLFPQQENLNGSYPPFYSYQMTDPRNSIWQYAQSECVQGLVLFGGFVIWNQTMRRFLNLPLPEPERSNASYLGYDPLEGKHKVLYLSRELAWIHTLGAQESWRIISKPSPFHLPCPFRKGGGRCFNGILYYRAFLASLDDARIIMSFDMRSEKFKPIKFPKGLNAWGYTIISYEGRIALVSPRISAADTVDLHVLEDEDGHKWILKRFLLPWNRDKTLGRSCLNLHGATDAGELIFVPDGLTESLSQSFYILYFDPRRNSIREAYFKGVAGAEFRSLYGPAGNKNSILRLDVFPNHIESLIMSL